MSNRYIHVSDNSYRIVEFNELGSFFPPNTSVPQGYFGNPSMGIYRLEENLASTNDFFKKVVVSGDPTLSQDGTHYILNYEVIDMTDEEKNEVVEARRSEVRMKRTEKLQETDWVVTYYLERGLTVPASWQEYRQQLRDLPDLITLENLEVEFPSPPPFIVEKVAE